MKVIVTFSGGKDSLAALLWVRNNLTKDFITVFCDTGWEHPLTYQYINEITHKLNLNLVTLRSKKYNGMIDMSMKKKRFPSMGKRYCTQELKIVPTTDYLLDVVKDDFIVIQGIRAAESPNRAKMAAQCNYFKYYLEPIETNTALLPKLLERLNSKMKASRRTELIERIGKIKNRLELGKEDPKFRSYRRKEILSFAKTHATDIWRPVFDWSAQQVIDYILDNGLEPNPLYRMGFKRVGCFPCIMSSLPEIYQMVQRFPNRIAGIARYEQVCKSSFLGPDKIPRKYYKGAYPLITDVARYVKEEYARGTLFDETEGTSSFSCMSYYAGVCE